MAKPSGCAPTLGREAWAGGASAGSVSILDYFTINLRGTHEHFVNPTQQDYDLLDEGTSRRRRPPLVLGARRVAKWPQAAIVLHREGFLRAC